jgi:hypothetical protein
MAELPDVSGVDPTAGVFPVLPKGQYPIEFFDSETKVTNSGNGQYLRLHPRVISGPHNGEKMRPIDLNLWNDNPQTVQIAERMLAQICHATNTLGARDSAQFHHKALLVELYVESARIGTDGKNYGESNRAVRFLPIDGATSSGGIITATTGGSGAQAGQPAKPAGSAPWRK